MHVFYRSYRIYNEITRKIDSEDLQPGAMILSLDGNFGIVESVVVVEDVYQPMYNLTVDEAHTFFIGDGDWLVHNESYLRPDYYDDMGFDIAQPIPAEVDIQRRLHWLEAIDRTTKNTCTVQYSSTGHDNTVGFLGYLEGEPNTTWYIFAQFRVDTRELATAFRVKGGNEIYNRLVGR